MREICLSLCLAALASACGPTKPAESPSHEDESPPAGSTASPAAAAETPPAPPPPPPPPSSGVPYDKESVEIGLKRAARQVKANCGAATDDTGKATGPWGKGTVTVTLGHNGHAQGTTVSAPFDGKPVGKCIAQAFALLTYPPFAGADTPVDWPIEVAPPGGH